ncbi:MAG: LD-carboxypeptidase [Bacteroidales bacterium]
MLKAPVYLKKGDRVQLISPSGRIQPQAVENARNLLMQWELKMQLSSSVLAYKGPFAGSDQERLHDLQAALDDPDSKAIFCSRGGYGCARIVDALDFTEFKKHPKWLVGFSDITVLHSCIHNLGFQTIHAVMPNGYPLQENDPIALSTLYKALFGHALEYQWQGTSLNREGVVQAPIIGGNLSVLYSLRATPTDLDTAHKILFIEDLNEYYYHLDRMMSNLYRGGLLSELVALLVGEFSQMKEGVYAYGKSANEIIREYVAPYNYPVAFDFPAGHIQNNHAFYLGRDANLSITNDHKQTQLTYL